MVWKPKRPPVVSRWLSIVVIRRTPLAPRGWPIAMAPPRGLYFAGSGRNSLAHMSAMAANASLHSMASNSSIFMPVRSSSLRVTGFGADSTSTGSSASTAKCTKRARIGRPSRSAVARSAISIADAPSLIGDEFPAVMSGAGCSSDSQTAGNSASCSSDVPRRIASSLRSTSPVGSPCSSMSGTGRTSRSKNPESTPAAARR